MARAQRARVMEPPVEQRAPNAQHATQQPNGVGRALGLLALLVALGLAPLFVLRSRARALDARASFAQVFAAEQLPAGWSFGAAHELADGARILELRREIATPAAFAQEPAVEEASTTSAAGAVPTAAEPDEGAAIEREQAGEAVAPAQDPESALASADPLPVELLLVQVDGPQELANWFPARPPPLGMGMGPGGGGTHGQRGMHGAPRPGNRPASRPASQPPTQSTSQPASAPASQPSTQPASDATSQPASAPSDAPEAPEHEQGEQPEQEWTMRIVLATGDLEWGTWRAAYVLERWVPSKEPLRESLRLNLSHAGRFAMLRANWAPGAPAVPAELVRLLEQLELRAGPKAAAPSAQAP